MHIFRGAQQIYARAKKIGKLWPCHCWKIDQSFAQDGQFRIQLLPKDRWAVADSDESVQKTK
jgi:hypothetical protein